ncbi:hypothetical protein AB0876_19230 [Mycobacterium sp. NPDC049093]
MRKNTIRAPRQGWEYWRLNRIDDESLQWLAISLPEARAGIDRSKVWTLIRILRPERCLTLDQLDRYPADKILGARVARLLRHE